VATQNEKKNFNQKVFDYMDLARENKYSPFWISNNAEQAALRTAPHVGLPEQRMRDLHDRLEGKSIANPASLRSLFY